MTEVLLPLSFYVGIVPIANVKEAKETKINLVINKPAPSAVSIFEDVVESLQAREHCTNKKQIAFVYHN